MNTHPIVTVKIGPYGAAVKVALIRLTKDMVQVGWFPNGNIDHPHGYDQVQSYKRKLVQFIN